MVKIFSFEQIEYGQFGGENTGWFNLENLRGIAKIEWTVVDNIIEVFDFKVTPFVGKKGQGVGTAAWKYFEDLFPKGTTFTGAVGHYSWSEEMNKLALDFWVKMGMKPQPERGETHVGKTK